MKKIVPILLFIFLSGLLYFANPDQTKFSPDKKITLQSSSKKNQQLNTSYNFDVKFDPQAKILNVTQNIVWINRTKFPTNEIQFNLFANAFSNDKTILSKTLEMSKKHYTEFLIDRIEVNGNKKNLEYFSPSNNRFDSTCAKINFDYDIKSNDTVFIQIDYSLSIPLALNRLGYASGRNFNFISEWYPKIGVFKNGKWKVHPYYPYANFYSEFADYELRINIPENYKIIANEYYKYENNGNGAEYYFSKKHCKDFTFAVSDEIIIKERIFKDINENEIAVTLAVQPEHEKYFERYFFAIKNSLEWLDLNIGEFPSEHLTLIDLPKSALFGSYSYSNIFTITTDLFLPNNNYELEYNIAKHLASQYFRQSIKADFVKSAWLSEGISAYSASKILNEFYDKSLLTFYLAEYVPIYGLNVHSYNEIPIIYSLSDLIVTEGTKSLEGVLTSNNLSSISDPSYKLPNRETYLSNAVFKPELMLISFERIYGKDKLLLILKDYYSRSLNSYSNAEFFWESAESVIPNKINWFKENIFQNSEPMDYRIISISKVADESYEVLAENNGGGYFKNDIALITEKDTLWQIWDSNERWKTFSFNTPHNVVGAEIDPYRKNLFDANFANNSYTLEIRVWGSLSISLRWFFWIQNALMSLGSAG